MTMLKKVSRYLKSPRKIIRPMGAKGFLNWLPDKTYLKLVYWGETGKKLNLKNPKSYNEKLQWLKLNDRKKEYNTYVDKDLVRNYIKENIGERYLVPIMGVYNNVDDIDWAELPERFVLKCTHGSGSNIICKDKKTLDVDRAKKQLNIWMKRNWYWLGREWAYKDLEPKIICEEFLEDNITDYKFMCFHGEPKIIQVHCDREIDHTLDFYDTNWEKTEIRRPQSVSSKPIPRPEQFEEMLYIARKLSKDEIHVRVDLFEVGGKIYFSEKTYFSASGFSLFKKDEYDEILGSWIKLPEK